MILQKCCHDIDILIYLIGRRIKSVSSFGGLYYFKPERAPAGAGTRCTDGCAAREKCPYDAEKIYITGKPFGIAQGHTGWPLDVLTNPATEESVRQAIETGPYGRCVFACGNDAVDHQVVNLELEDGVTAHLTMSAFTPDIYRTIQVMGTLGQIDGDIRNSKLKLSVFGREPREIKAANSKELGGHGGGDERMFDRFVKLVEGETEVSPSSIENSVESHLACFAAERSRLNGGAPEKLR
jgi:predicted dehydrogenase